MGCFSSKASQKKGPIVEKTDKAQNALNVLDQMYEQPKPEEVKVEKIPVLKEIEPEIEQEQGQEKGPQFTR